MKNNYILKKKKKRVALPCIWCILLPHHLYLLNWPLFFPDTGRWGRSGGERLAWPAPASSRSLGIFSSLGGLLVRGAQVFNLPCQPCLPSPPRKVYGQLGAGLLMQPQSSTRRDPALISCPSLSCNRRFFNRVGSSHARH